MEPIEFIVKWRKSELKERSASQEHFLDLCRMLGEPTPAEADPSGQNYCFEKGATKSSGGSGWADVWKRGHFGWEYKGPHGNLDRALNQLRQYALALENPPLLVVCDTHKFRIQTNWTNSVSKTYEFDLEELTEPRHRDCLKAVFSDPEQLKPGTTRQMLTETAAATFAELAQALRDANHDAEEIARFVNRLVFCMYAEDAGLLPDQMFSRMLAVAAQYPQRSAALASDLFQAMTTGGMIGYEQVDWFNGRLFDSAEALSLSAEQVATVRKVSALDWSEIDPAILGSLFERGLDPAKRKQQGAHYTDSDKIMRIIDPVIVQPWIAEWGRAKAEISKARDREISAKSKATRTRREAETNRLMEVFLRRLRAFRVLDPACGSGNFLYLALMALKDLELKVQLEAEALGLQRGWPEIGPESVKGIEINPFAAELARVSVWIGELQWMRRNGFGVHRAPILKPLDHIECRDALLTREGNEAGWPDADVVIGNPPFLGGKRLVGELGQSYTLQLRRSYPELPAFSDLVCYWFHKAAHLVENGRLARAGLVATNSIRGGKNRTILDRISQKNRIFNAWSDEPWVLDGAAVRVSLISFADRNENLPIRLDDRSTSSILSNLTAEIVNLTRVRKLERNRDTAFIGDQKSGPFNVPGSLAREWLRMPSNPNGRPNSNVLRPWMNGRDLTRRPSGQWIIDFGWAMSEGEAALYEAPFEYVREHVWPKRQASSVRASAIHWWQHWCPRPEMWKALDGLSRCVATPTVAKHRLFAWVDSRVCPDHQLVVIARDDYTTFGILHSRFHEAWSLRLCTWQGKGNDPRYTPTTTFQTFPFPDGLSPDVPASEYSGNAHAVAIAAAAKNLDDHRSHWLNPPELVEWVAEPVPGYPERPVPRSGEADKRLKQRTLTNLYNAQPQWLVDLHSKVDAAVAAAYGWPAEIEEEAFLADLVERNLSDDR